MINMNLILPLVLCGIKQSLSSQNCQVQNPFLNDPVKNEKNKQQTAGGATHPALFSFPSLGREEFAQWLSGFVDAEGNFQVFFDRIYVRVLFRIVLHKDDIQILYKIKNYLDVGTVRISGDSCIYSIGKKEDLINNLFPILDKYTLLTTKFFEYSTSRIQGNNLTLVKEIINQMNSAATQEMFMIIL